MFRVQFTWDLLHILYDSICIIYHGTKTRKKAALFLLKWRALGEGSVVFVAPPANPVIFRFLLRIFITYRLQRPIKKVERTLTWTRRWRVRWGGRWGRWWTGRRWCRPASSCCLQGRPSNRAAYFIVAKRANEFSFLSSLPLFPFSHYGAWIYRPSFRKKQPECLFSMTDNERFGLVFARHGSINSARQCLAPTCHFSQLLTNTGGLAYPFDWEVSWKPKRIRAWASLYFIPRWLCLTVMISYTKMKYEKRIVHVYPVPRTQHYERKRQRR